MITNETKNELYKLLKGDNANLTNRPIGELGEPEFIKTIDTNFKTIIKDKLKLLGVTDDTENLNVAGLKIYKTKKIVYGSYGRSITPLGIYGFISVFDLDNNLLEVIIDVSTGTDKELLGAIRILDIDSNGIIYGISDPINQLNDFRAYFYRLNDILDDIGVIDFADLDIFYTGIIDLTTETPKDPTKPAGDHYGSLKVTKDTQLVNIKASFNEENTYFIVGWEDQNNAGQADRKIRLIKISIPLGSTKQDACDWKINENIRLNNALSDSLFQDVAGIYLAPGNKSFTDHDVEGSVLVAVDDKTNQDKYNPLTKIVTDADSVVRWDIRHAPYETASGDKATALIKQEFGFAGLLQNYKNFINGLPGNARNIEAKLQFQFNTLTGPKNQVFTLSVEETKKILNNDRMELIYNIIAQAKPTGNANGTNREYDIQLTDYVDFSSNTLAGDGQLVNHQNLFKQNPPSMAADFGFLYWRTDADNTLLETFIKTHTFNDLIAYIKIKPVLSVTYEVNEPTSNKFETALISIQNVKSASAGGSKIKCLITEAQDNVLKGTAPVFINMFKAYMPLMDRDEGLYAVWEFNAENVNTLNTEYTKTYNDRTPTTLIGQVDYKIILPSIIPNTGVIEVKVNGTATTDYTLTETVLIIHNSSSDQKIEVNYKTFFKTPKKLTPLISTNSDDFIITSINNKNEIDVTNNSIVGIGDDGTHSFGMVLYKSKDNIDSDSIVEKSIPYEFHATHAEGTRQNNVMYMYCYNADFTKESKWTSIYSESFVPYTYKPYDNHKTEFVLERFNAEVKGGTEGVIFDNKFVNISSSSSVTLASTEAKLTDFNFQGDAVISIYGYTNKKLFEFDLNGFNKTDREAREINVNLNVGVVDKTSGVEINRNEASATLSKLFNIKNGDVVDLNRLKVKIIYADDTTSTHVASNYLSIDVDILKFKATLVKKTKDMKSIQLINNENKLLAETDLCDGDVKNVTWDIKIE